MASNRGEFGVAVAGGVGPADVGGIESLVKALSFKDNARVSSSNRLTANTIGEAGVGGAGSTGEPGIASNPIPPTGEITFNPF